jgi:hypothetical protein
MIFSSIKMMTMISRSVLLIKIHYVVTININNKLHHPQHHSVLFVEVIPQCLSRF